MLYDLFIILILFAWSFARIIEKKLLINMDFKEFTKWIILIGSVLVLPLIPFIKLSSLNIMLGIFLTSLLWMSELFSKSFAIKKEEVSRLGAFSHFKFLFAITLTTIFLGETANINTILGSVLVILGGVSIGLEKKVFKKLKVSNIAILFIILSMFFSGIAYFIRQFLLQKVDPFSIMFFSTIFAGLIVLPTLKEKFKIPNFKLLLLSQFLMTYGFLLLLWILSKQELVFTVPLLAIQPLIILILGRRFLKESKETFLYRLFGIILIILGYLILKGIIL